MNWLTDLIRKYPELAAVEARYHEMARPYAELRQEYMSLYVVCRFHHCTLTVF